MSGCPLASPDRPAIEAVLFDLDDTLYRIEAIPERVRENIEGEDFFFFFFLAADLNFFVFFSLSPPPSIPPFLAIVLVFTAFMIDRLKIDREVVPELVRARERESVLFLIVFLSERRHRCRRR